MTLLERILQHPDVVKQPRSSGEAKAWCPWHPDRAGGKPSLGINEKKGVVKCWSCGKGGVRELAKAWDIEDEPVSTTRRRKAPASAMSRDEALDALKTTYKLRSDTLKHFNIRAIPEASSPDRRKRGAWRYPTGAGTRYKAFDRQAPHKVWWARNTDADKRRSLLYGVDDIEQGAEAVYLVNGEPSVWVCHQAGIPAVAAFGEGNLTEGQASSLMELGVKQVRVVLDLDGAGARATSRDVELLQDADLEALALGLPHYLGGKADIADLYLWHDGDDEKFRAAVEGLAVRPLPPADPLRDTRYSVKRNRFYQSRDTRNGIVEEPITNFTARAVEEILLDDGMEPILHQRFVGRLDTGEQLKSVRVEAAKATSLNWIHEKWGFKPVIKAGLSNRDAVREIIQRLSLQDGLPRQTIYKYTGWKRIDGEWRMLMPGAGMVDGTHVELADAYERYGLPKQTLKGQELVQAARASMRSLYVADRSVTIPLLAFTYLAPLQSILRPAFALWLQAKTGSYKSSMAALAMSHFGDFEYNTPPLTWEATSRGIERYLHDLKDCMAWVDDFRPGTTEQAVRIRVQKATEVLASVGNVQSRGRMRADTTMQKTLTPQALMLNTAELPPSGDSIIARTLPVRFVQDQVDLGELTMAQAERDLYSHAMRAYIDWLAPQYEELRQGLAAKVQEYRDQVPTNGAHARSRGAIANLQVGIDLLCAFAEEVGARTSEECQELKQEAWQVFLTLGEGHTDRLREEDPVLRFNAALDTLLSQEKGVFLAKGSDDPIPYGKDLLGWYDGDYLYMDFLASYNAVAQFNRHQGSAIGMTEVELRQAYAERGLIVRRDGKHLATRMRLNGRRHRVVLVPRDLVPYGEHFKGELDQPHLR